MLRFYITLEQLQLHPAGAPGDAALSPCPAAWGASARLVPIGALGTAAPSNVSSLLTPGWSSPQGPGQGQVRDGRSEMIWRKGVRGRDALTEKLGDKDEGRDGRAKNKKQRKHDFPQKVKPSSRRQACVFKALQKLILCGSRFTEEAWLGAPAGQDREADT